MRYLILITSLAALAVSQGLLAEPENEQPMQWVEDSEKVIDNPEKYLDNAESYRSPELDPDIVEQAKEMADKAQEVSGEQLKKMEFGEQQWAAEKASENMQKRQNNSGSGLKDNSLLDPDETRYVLFISTGLPEDVLRESLRALNGHDNAVAIISGLIEEDHSIGETVAELRTLIQELGIDPKKGPDVFLEPTLFRELNVKSVPRLVRYDGPDPVISVKGTANIDWLDRQYEDGREGDLGEYGNTYEITEENLMVTIKKRAADIDADKQIDNAIDTFWENKNMHRLPEAQEDNSFLVDPSITVQQDIRTQTGQVIARAGQKLNPLDKVPFPRVGLVFDGTDEDQLEWAIEQGKKAAEKNLTPVYMTTEVDQEEGWDSFEAMNERTPLAMKMVDKLILDRFQISKVPSKFYQQDDKIRVDEVAIDEIR